MNTIKKGDILENQLFTILSKQIEDDRFSFYKKENLKIYQKKRYFSDKRQEDIIFDVAVEVSQPNRSDRPHIILIFECKNYSSAISIDNVEEFLMKTQQIVQHASTIKPILVTNAKLQRSTENFIKNSGIGYIQLSENQLDISNEDWVLQRSPSWYDLENNESDLAASITLSTGKFPAPFSVCCLSSKYLGFSFNAFLNDFLKDTILNSDNIKSNHFKPIIPFISNEEIEKKAIEIRQNSNKLGMDFLNDLIKLEQQKTGLKVIFDVNPNLSALGSISFQKNEITIYLQKNSHRNTFTLAHELAHYYLKHGVLIKQEIMSQNHLNIKFKNSELQKMEYQANMLASCLLLPKLELIQKIRYITFKLNIKDKGYGLLYLDSQKCNQDNFYTVTDILKDYFKVSREALKIRLLQLGILKISE